MLKLIYIRSLLKSDQFISGSIFFLMFKASFGYVQLWPHLIKGTPVTMLSVYFLFLVFQSGSSTIASSGYHMLKTILCMHSPMASPSLGKIYLQSMLPPTRHIEGFEMEDDTPIRCHWDFMDRVIR